MMRRKQWCNAGIGILGVLYVSTAFANPQGGQVVGGNATIQSGGHRLDVHQHSDKAIIDWRSFDIDVGEHTQFHQPSAGAIALNRVKSADPSSIMGTLTANGNVVLVNPNGVFFGKGSRVDVNGLIATTADIANRDFMQGRFDFSIAGNPDAVITNEGVITAKEAGLVGLVAPNVQNSGMIRARLGKVQLATGDQFAVDLYGDGLLNIAVSEEVTQQLLRNTGSIEAEGGQISLTAAAGRNLVDNLIIVSGEVKAPKISRQGGKIVISGTQADVTVKSGAVLDAIGAHGGGDIQIGGDYLGTGDTPRARSTTIEQGAVINASATQQGNGGRVIVWSDERTEFGVGTTSILPVAKPIILARGGASGGDGGFVETSSKKTLIAEGLVDAAAPNGKAGLWLLDPNNITIQSGGGDTNVSVSPNFSSTNDNAIVTTGSIETALNAGTSVTVLTTSSGTNAQDGDITVSDSITKSAGGDATLTLSAHDDINVNDDITSTSGALDIVLNADNDADQAGGIHISGATLDSNGGDITMGGGANPATTAAYGSGDIRGVRIQSGSNILAKGGDISIRGVGDTLAGSSNVGIRVEDSSVIQTTGGGTITMVGTGGDGTSDNYGVHILDAGTLITTVDGLISITGTGGNGTQDDNRGIYMTAGNITSTGTGAGVGGITLNGTGGGGTDQLYGVQFANAGTDISTVDGDINITGVAGNGSSADQYGVYSYGGSVVQSTGTGTNAGNITINGTGGDATEDNHGFYFSTSSVTTVDGDISITGRAGNGTLSRNRGFYLSSAATVTSTGTGTDAGTITINGIGGGGVDTLYGVYLTGAGTSISSDEGAINITATAGSGSGVNNYGMYMSNTASIQSTGTGSNGATITVNATGGASTNDNHGFHLNNATVTSVDGDVAITGTAGNGTADDNRGIVMTSSASVSSTGTGADAATIALTGNGGNGGTNQNFGVFIEDSATVQSIDGNITVTGQGGNGNANENIGIYVFDSGVIRSTGTGTDAAAIILNGTGGAGGTDNSGGIYIRDAGSLITSVDGDISLTGVARNGSGDSNHGVQLYLDGDITSTGTGTDAATITLNGTGGNGDQYNYGVRMDDTGTLLTSVDGAISVTGVGGNGTGDANYGIGIRDAANLTSTGTGANAATITLNGTGGNGTVNNDGVAVFSTGTLITSDEGNISITGTGGNGSGDANRGIRMSSDADITSTGTGANAATITLTGTGGDGALYNYGIRLENAGTSLASIDGNVTLNGTGGNGSGDGNHGVGMRDDADIITTGAADITLNGTKGANTSNDLLTTGATVSIGGGAATGDITFTMDDQSFADLSVQTSGDIILTPRSAATTVGVSGAAGSLQVTDTVLGFMNPGGQFTIGRTDGSGNLELNARNWLAENLELRTGSGTITVNGALTNLGNLTMTTDASPSVGAGIAGSGTFTLQQASTSTSLGVGTGGAPNVSVVDAAITQIQTGFSTYVFGRTDGGDVTNYVTSWEDPLTFLANGNFTNASATSSDDTILVRAAGDVILNDDMATTSATAHALVLSAGDDFLNNAGSDALSATNSRWLVYSDEPAGNTRDGLLPDASEFGKTYAADAPATIGANNRFVYATSTQPTLTYAVDDDTAIVGNDYDGSYSMTYQSGLVGDDTLSNIGLTGAPVYSTTYSAGTDITTYPGALTATSGTMANPLGYLFNITAGNLTTTSHSDAVIGLPVVEAPVEPVLPIEPEAEEPVIADEKPVSGTSLSELLDIPSTVIIVSQEPAVMIPGGSRRVEMNPVNDVLGSFSGNNAGKGELKPKRNSSNDEPVQKMLPGKAAHTPVKVLGGLVRIHPKLLEFLGGNLQGDLFN